MKKIFYKLISLMLFVILLSSSIPANTFASENNAEYRENAIEVMSDNNFLRGNEKGDLMLKDAVERDEMIALTIRLKGEEYESQVDMYQLAETTYTDDKEIEDWSRGYITYGTEKGYVDGYPEDGSVKPNQNVKYEEAVKFVVSTAEGGTDYEYPVGYIQRAGELGYLEAVDGTVGEDMSREMIAVLLYNAFGINITNKTGSLSQEFEADSENAVKSVRVDYELNMGIGAVEMYDSTDERSGVASLVGRVGDVFTFTATENNLSSAKIVFEYDEAQLGISEDNLGIVCYSGYGNVQLLDAELNRDSNEISVETDHFSEYVLVDKTEWFAAWRQAQTVARTDETADIVFAVDASGSMGGDDGNDVEGMRKVAVNNFIDQLQPEDAFSVLSFDGEVQDILPYQTVSSIDSESVHRAVLNISDMGTTGTNIHRVVNRAVDILNGNQRENSAKIIILLTDGAHNGTINYGYDNIEMEFDDSCINRAVESGIKIYTIALGAESSQETDFDVLREIASRTVGADGFYIASSEDVINVYQDIFSSQLGVEPIDSDGDGIYDGIETAGMRNQFGNVIRTDPDDPDTDGDGLSDGEEVGNLLENTNVSDEDVENGIYSYRYYMMSSDPFRADSDGDEIIDPEDEEPWINNKIYPVSTDNKLTLNGRTISLSYPITEYKGRKYIPMNEVFDIVGAKYLANMENEIFPEELPIVYGGISDGKELNNIIVLESAGAFGSESGDNATSFKTNGYINDVEYSTEESPYVYADVENEKCVIYAPAHFAALMLTLNATDKAVFTIENDNVSMTCREFTQESDREYIYNNFMMNGMDIEKYEAAKKEFKNDEGFWESYLAYDFANAFDTGSALGKSVLSSLVNLFSGSEVNIIDDHYYYMEGLDYKNAILEILSDISEDEQEEPSYINDDAYEFTEYAVTLMSESNDLSIETLKERWNSDPTKAGKQIGTDMRYKINRQYKYLQDISGSLKQLSYALEAYDIIKDAALTLTIDYSDEMEYLYTLSVACEDSETISRVIDEIEEEYTGKYNERVMNYTINTLKEEVYEKGTSAIFGAINSCYSLAEFATEAIASGAGWNEYAEKVDYINAYVRLTGHIAEYSDALREICYDSNNQYVFGTRSDEELNNMLAELNQEYESLEITGDDLRESIWKEYANAFILTKASMLKGYWNLYQVEGLKPFSDIDYVKRLQYIISMNEISRIYINREFPGGDSVAIQSMFDVKIS